VIEDVAGVDGNFAATAGSIDDKLGNSVAAGESAKGFNNFDSLADRSAKVGASADEITLVEVVGANSTHQQFVHEVFHYLNIVIHAFEKHTLIAQRNSVVGQKVETVPDLGGEFFRVVGMNAHPKGMVLLKHAAKLRGDALGKKNGDPTPDAEELDMRDGSYPAQEIFQFVIGKKQGITTGKENIADFGVRFEIAKSFFEVGVQFLFPGAAYDAAAGAIPAVGGAAIGNEKEDPVGIPMDEAGDGHVIVLAAGIGHFALAEDGLFEAGNDLPPDWAMRVGWIDQVEKMWSDPESEFLPG